MIDIRTLLSDYTFQVVAIGSALLGIISGVLGSYAVLRKQSLLGDGISHAALPGVVLAFLLIGSKHTETLLIGALITGLIATFIIMMIVKYTRIKFDSALALVLSVFFGLGLVLLTYSQKIPNANQAGLDRFIYGQTSALLERDLYLTLICGAVMLVIVALFWKEFKLLCFDPEFAKTIGFPTEKLNFLLSSLIVVSIIIGLQTVGVILMSAMLIAPAVAARQWSNRLSVMVILSAIFGGVSGVVGTLISSSMTKIPTGPTIVVCITLIAVFSLLFAPGRGIIHKAYQRRQNRINFERERQVEKNVCKL